MSKCKDSPHVLLKGPVTRVDSQPKHRFSRSAVGTPRLRSSALAPSTHPSETSTRKMRSSKPARLQDCKNLRGMEDDYTPKLDTLLCGRAARPACQRPCEKRQHYAKARPARIPR